MPRKVLSVLVLVLLTIGCVGETDVGTVRGSMDSSLTYTVDEEVGPDQWVRLSITRGGHPSDYRSSKSRTEIVRMALTALDDYVKERGCSCEEYIVVRGFQSNSTDGVLCKTAREENRPTVVYSSFMLGRVPESALYHIGNYSAAAIEVMDAAACRVGATYYRSAPYSLACSKPGTKCSWEYGTQAFHVERGLLGEFWSAFRAAAPRNILSGEGGEQWR